jgi:hypothetical protein
MKLKKGRVGAGPHGIGGAKPGGLDGKRMKLPRIRLARLDGKGMKLPRIRLAS